MFTHHVVSNTGNTDITSLQLSDTLTDLDNVELSLDGPISRTDSYTLIRIEPALSSEIILMDLSN